MLRRVAQDHEPAAPPVEEDEGPRRRRVGGRKTTAVLLLFALVFLAIAVLRVVGIDGNVVTVPAVALTPYVVVGGILLFLIAFGLRRRILAVAVLVMSLSMVALLLPRVFADDQPTANGAHVRVLAANLNDGKADIPNLVRLVRDNRVDVLTLPELSRADMPQLDQAGIADVLPYRVVDPGNPGDGSGIFSRFPLRQTALVDALELSMPSAVVDLPGRADMEIVATHVQSALHGSADVWRRDLARQPPPRTEQVRVLAGDFNASFDHAAFRALLDRGYVDAAEQTGKGLIPTWMGWGPPITIDHVLVDHRCAILSYLVLALPGSDHNAVLAEFALP